MCIVAGCDYVKNVRGIGINCTFQSAPGDEEMFNNLKRKGADKEYCIKFNNVITVFRHQTVFDIDTCSTVPLEGWDSDPSMEIQYLFG